MLRSSSGQNSRIFCTLYISLGRQAGIYYHYGVEKYELEEKMSASFAHNIVKPSSPLVRGINDVLYAPHSRHTEVRQEDIEAVDDLEIIAVSDEAGVFIAKSTNSRHFFCFWTSSTITDTLAKEYACDDLGKGLNPRCQGITSPMTTRQRRLGQTGAPRRSCFTPIG